MLPQEGLHQRGIVVARDEHHLGVASQLRPQRAQHGLGRFQSMRRATLQQLDDVAEQDQAIHVLQGPEQRVERLGAQEHRPVQAGTQMEIGYDERAHGLDLVAAAGAQSKPSGRLRAVHSPP